MPVVVCYGIVSDSWRRGSPFHAVFLKMPFFLYMVSHMKKYARGEHPNCRKNQFGKKPALEQGTEEG